MPFFDGIVTHSNAYGQLLSLERGEIKGIGIYDTIDDRDQQPQGNPAATNMVRGFLAIVKDADGNGTTKAYLYTGAHNPNANPEISEENWQNAANWTEVGGGTGTQGEPGTPGQDGVTFTPAVNPVVGSLDPGSTPTVSITSATTSATEGVMTFSFSLAQGEQGEQGPTGVDGTTFTPVITEVDSLNPASAATASVNAANGEAQFTFGIPRGEQGAEGPEGPEGPAGPTGETGATGSAGTTYTPEATATTLDAGEDATVTVSVSGSVATYSFGIPRGSDGAPGDDGQDGAPGADGVDGTTFTPVATATTLEPGSDASASVISSSLNGVATYTFGIPRGETGAQGTAGPIGPTGPAGSISELTNVDADPVASSFLFAPSGTTHLAPHTFTGATGVDIVVSGTAVTTELDFSELPQATANGGSALYEILTESNGGRGIEIVAYDPDQGEVTVSYYNILANLANLIVVDAVENDPNVTIDSYGGSLAPADVDGDGVVGVNDLLEVLSVFGLDAVLNGQVQFIPLNSSSMSTADPVLYSILDFDGVSPNTKVYFPIDQEGQGDSFYSFDGSFDINISGTGLTDGTGYIEFLSGSSGSAPINANTNKNGITFFSFRVWAKTESGVAELTSGFDYEYLTSSNTSIASGSYSAYLDTVNVDGVNIISDSQQNLSQGFIDHMVETHGSDGFSYSNDQSLSVPSTVAKIRVKPWFSCNSQDVRLYTGVGTEPYLTSFEPTSRLTVKFYRSYAN